MSWDAYLTDDRGHNDGEWNYTHNTNGMIGEALKRAEVADLKVADNWFDRALGPVWWQLLDGSSGQAGKTLLDAIIREFEADPSHFRAMNPDNGWGNFDQLVGILKQMSDAVPDWPTEWRVNG